MKRIFMGLMPLCVLVSCSSGSNDESATEVKSAESAAPVTPPATELLDMSITAPFKSSTEALARNDLDAFLANYADTALSLNSAGDSLIGKDAIKAYWVSRWKMIDSMNISNMIYLPVKVNEPQIPTLQKGDWVLQWAMVNVKYKNGKRLTFWVHTTSHLNSAGKVDRTNSFVDRAPIMAATKGM